MAKNRVSLFLVWNTSPEELREFADALRRCGNVSFTVRTQQGINVIVMLEAKTKHEKMR